MKVYNNEIKTSYRGRDYDIDGSLVEFYAFFVNDERIEYEAVIDYENAEVIDCAENTAIIERFGKRFLDSLVCQVWGL